MFRSIHAKLHPDSDPDVDLDSDSDPDRDSHRDSDLDPDPDLWPWPSIPSVSSLETFDLQILRLICREKTDLLSTAWTAERREKSHMTHVRDQITWCHSAFECACTGGASTETLYVCTKVKWWWGGGGGGIGCSQNRKCLFICQCLHCCLRIVSLQTTAAADEHNNQQRDNVKQQHEHEWSLPLHSGEKKLWLLQTLTPTGGRLVLPWTWDCWKLFPGAKWKFPATYDWREKKKKEKMSTDEADQSRAEPEAPYPCWSVELEALLI